MDLQRRWNVEQVSLKTFKAPPPPLSLTHSSPLPSSPSFCLPSPLLSSPSLAPRYSGPSLLEAINSFSPPPRPLLTPLRVSVSEAVRSRSLGAVAVAGKVEAGALRPNMKVRGGGGGFRSFFIFVVSKVTTFPVGLSVPTCLKTKWKL